MPQDNTFTLDFSRFYRGFSPDAHLDSLSELGNQGHASTMTDCDIISNPRYLTQGPGLTSLGTVTEIINYILDQPTSSDVSFALGAAKLWKISSTAVASGGTPSWPRTITNCTDGESLVLLRGNLYYLFNKSSGGDIGKYDLSSTFDDDWGSTTPTGYAALQKAIHPVAKKEDMFAFGNGRYFGTYVDESTTLAPTKLDFGNDAEVADVAFSSNYWLIAVNYGVSGTNRNTGQVYLYEGAAISSLLSDEVAIGVQRIGFIFPINGVVFLAYQDLTSTGGYKIGYISGSSIKDVAHYTGSLPGFHQKTLYKNTILFIAGSKIWSAGAVIDELPFQISQLADGGYATVGALGAPFGTPLVASTDGGSNHQLAYFSGFTISTVWKSIVIPTIRGGQMGTVDRVIVLTNVLGSAASCSLTIEANQATDTSNAKTITTATKTYHEFTNFNLNRIEDLRVALDFSGGSTSNNVGIRKIIVLGHFID